MRPALSTSRGFGAAKLAGALVLAAACSSAKPAATSAPPLPPVTEPQITALIPARVPARPAWAQAVADGLRVAGVEVNAVTSCAVIAVIAQETGFQADPVVPGLANIVAKRIESYQSRLGPLGGPVFRRLLAGHAPADPRTFQQRLATVRTERDLDLVFRDLLAYYKGSYPSTFEAVAFAGKLFDGREVDDLNPITTAGPMQVSVRFAEDWARAHHGDVTRVRDALYTRAGGVSYGTARLYASKAPYPRMIFHFADYNAGVFASRNAAVQAQVARLTGKKLALDGDLLAYGPDGEVANENTQSFEAIRLFRDRHAPNLSDRRLRKDVRSEKTLDFEDTDTYRALKTTYNARFGAPAYAILPDVVLDSPKLSRKRSTAWFAAAVDKRFKTCLSAAGVSEPTVPPPPLP